MPLRVRRPEVCGKNPCASEAQSRLRRPSFAEFRSPTLWPSWSSAGTCISRPSARHDLVERWFKELSDWRLRRGTFSSVPALSTPSAPGSATERRSQAIHLARSRRRNTRKGTPRTQIAVTVAPSGRPSLPPTKRVTMTPGSRQNSIFKSVRLSCIRSPHPNHPHRVSAETQL